MKDRLGREIPANVHIRIARGVLAEALWEYGEDALAERVLGLSDEDLLEIQRLGVWHRQNDPDPDNGPRLTNGRIMSRAAIDFFEGQGRDTKRQRRRTRPETERFANPRSREPG